MKPCLFFILLVGSFLLSLQAETVPWVEKPAYTVKDGMLFSVQVLTPESPCYRGYSVYYDAREDKVSYEVDDSWKRAFAQGFYAYRAADNPAMPFIRERIKPVERLIKEMKTFPPAKGIRGDKTDRYIIMDSDMMVQYHISSVMALASKLGHLYFFTGKSEDKKPVHWAGEKDIKLETVTSTASPDGWLLAKGRKDSGEFREAGNSCLYMIHPINGDFHELKVDFLSSGIMDLSGTEWMDKDRLVLLRPARWDETLIVINVKTGKIEFRVRFSREGNDTFISGKEIWMTNGREKAARLFPLPLEDPRGELKVSLSEYEVPIPVTGEFPALFSLCVTVTNQGKEPVSLPEGWGETVMFLYEGEGDNESSRDLYTEGRPVLKEGKWAPACVLEPGQSISVSSVYEINDYRVFPGAEKTVFRVSLTPTMKKGAPGNGVFTSAPLTLRNPVDQVRDVRNEALKKEVGTPPEGTQQE